MPFNLSYALQGLVGGSSCRYAVDPTCSQGPLCDPSLGGDECLAQPLCDPQSIAMIINQKASVLFAYLPASLGLSQWIWVGWRKGHSKDARTMCAERHELCGCCWGVGRVMPSLHSYVSPLPSNYPACSYPHLKPPPGFPTTRYLVGVRASLDPRGFIPVGVGEETPDRQK